MLIFETFLDSISFTSIALAFVISFLTVLSVIVDCKQYGFKLSVILIAGLCLTSLLALLTKALLTIKFL